IGYILVAPDRPRLSDARPLYLRRSRQVDWPSLIGVMQAAVEEGRPPFSEALRTCERLFSTQKIPLGVEHSLRSGPRPCGLMVDGERAHFARPRVIEMRNSRGEWERKPSMPVEAALGEALVWRDDRWRRALASADSLDDIGKGSLCRLPGKLRKYGRAIAAGTRDTKDLSRVRLVKP